MRAKLLAPLGAFLFLLFLVANAKNPLPFVSGERLEYEMKWGFFPVGYATMEVSQNESNEGNNSFLVNFSVRTNSFADTFYKVRTSITSQLDSSFSRTLYVTEKAPEISISLNFLNNDINLNIPTNGQTYTEEAINLSDSDNNYFFADFSLTVTQ